MEAVCVLRELPCKHNALLIWRVDKDEDGATSNENLNKADGPPVQNINTKGIPKFLYTNRTTLKARCQQNNLDTTRLSHAVFNNLECRDSVVAVTQRSRLVSCKNKFLSLNTNKYKTDSQTARGRGRSAQLDFVCVCVCARVVRVQRCLQHI